MEVQTHTNRPRKSKTIMDGYKVDEMLNLFKKSLISPNSSNSSSLPLHLPPHLPLYLAYRLHQSGYGNDAFEVLKIVTMQYATAQLLLPNLVHDSFMVSSFHNPFFIDFPVL